MIDLRTTLGPVAMASPLIAAAGTVGSVVEFTGTIDFSLYGAAVAKSVSPEPWTGRPTPRIGAIGSGMLNGIGIQNPGIDRWISEMRDAIEAAATPIWPSIVAHDADGFAVVAARLAEVRVQAIEINLSCPNLDGVPFALDPVLSHEVVSAVRRVTSTPLGAKLSPDARPVTDVAQAVVDAGADWIVMGNTVMGAGIDVTTRRPVISGLVGGYSGEPIRPITMRCVIEIRRHLPDTPILACGGVSTSEHAIEYLLAGADAVGLGSVHFARPRAAKRILAGIRDYMEREGFADIPSLKGAYRSWI